MLAQRITEEIMPNKKIVAFGRMAAFILLVLLVHFSSIQLFDHWDMLGQWEIYLLPMGIIVEVIGSIGWTMGGETSPLVVIISSLYWSAIIWLFYAGLTRRKYKLIIWAIAAYVGCVALAMLTVYWAIFARWR